MNVKKGFSLIELMIVVAIVGILAMVAYPSYTDSVRQSRRADGQAALLGLAQAMERFYTTNGTYVGAASGGVPTIFSTKAPIDGSDTYYNLKINSATGSAYELAAEAVNAQAGDGTLTLKSTGERSW
ncbi:type IV pilin protein [Psychromonas sp.]|uniref:type IV pilin protein n=1 Tax=Psychromonas sp. TaxID=1884585 RepID=UPI0035613241